ncbi:MAG TPA: hypothetical protein VMR33_06140 [Candidatus Baltobacteraceae bacterium]|jgi:hypothetical protein|nr:hypothetical protein [Candidatus Baltobacteraceae bacterium]
MQIPHPIETAASPVHDRRATDEDEVNRRRLRARPSRKAGVKTELPNRSDRDFFAPRLMTFTQWEGREPAPDQTRTPLPEDRPLSFAQAIYRRANGALIRCEECHPHGAPHSVLYVVVERDAARWRERLNSLHHDFFGPGRSDPLVPVRLEVIDRATHDALQRLVAAGLVAPTTRATRSLWPVDESTTSPPPLSEAERRKAGSYRCQAARKLKMADVLAGGDLGEEARLALLDAIEPLGRALAVENRLPEPQSLEDALLPPLGTAWKGALPLVRNFLREASQPVPPVLFVLGQV